MSVLDCKTKPSSFKKSCLKVPANDASPEILISENCYIKSSACPLLQIQLKLTPKYLYFNNQQNFETRIITKWSLIQTFYEEISSVNYFGFTIIKSGEKHEFFFTSSESLERWLELLSLHCILTNFEQDFITIKKIESTCMGAVNLCQDLNTGSEFAVKVLQKSFMRTSSQIKHIKNEIKSMKLVSHPDCVKLYKVYEDDLSIMLLMEYVPYGTLLSRLQKLKKFNENEVAMLARRMINVLIYFNSLNVIHRDLKLENILMKSAENNYDIKIADFGIAACSGKPQNSICGTPGFIAPEAFRGEFYNGKFDVFSVGVICFTLLTGKVPFSAKNTVEVLEKNKEVAVKFEKKHWKSISKNGWNFVQGLMNKDSKLRPSAEQADLHMWIFNIRVEKNIDFNVVNTESALVKEN